MQDAFTRHTLLDSLFADRQHHIETALRILKCRARAEDTVQEVALRIWRGGPCPDVLCPAGYVRRMVRNLAIDAMRRASLECRLFAPIAEAADAASPCACPHERMETCQALMAVSAALGATPDRTRRTFLAHRIDGVPQKALAAEIGVSPTLVNFMIRDATALCRKAVQDQAAGVSVAA